MLNEEAKDILRARSFAHVALVDERGRPHSSPVWVHIEGEHVLINTALGRVKDRLLQPGAPVAISALHPDDPYRYVGIRGKVAQRRLKDGATVIDMLAKKYTGRDYKARRDDRVTITIEAEHVVLYGRGR